MPKYPFVARYGGSTDGQLGSNLGKSYLEESLLNTSFLTDRQRSILARAGTAQGVAISVLVMGASVRYPNLFLTRKFGLLSGHRSGDVRVKIRLYYDRSV